MTPPNASRTALATSLMRAMHSRTAPAPLIDDSWGDHLVPETMRQAMPEPALRANAAYADVIVRTRYTEDALAAALARGVDQYVIIGAGFDSFAHRRPAAARALTVYEVDHPATLGLKRQRLQACGVTESSDLHYVAADLSREDLSAALAHSPFQPGRPTFFAWLGVTMYLSREANLAALRAIAASAAPGSELVLTYVDEAVFARGHAATDAFTELRQRVASVGEAFLSGFTPAGLSAQLEGIGFQLMEDLNGDEMVARYDADGINGLQSNNAAHIARARVR